MAIALTVVRERMNNKLRIAIVQQAVKTPRRKACKLANYANCKRQRSCKLVGTREVKYQVLSAIERATIPCSTKSRQG